LLAENVTLGAKGLTQSKKLLGFNTLHSDVNARNVWVSSKLNALTANTSSSVLQGISDIFSNNSVSTNELSLRGYLNPSIQNFNFFENSRMWLIMQYSLNSQLRSNLSRVETFPVNTSLKATQSLSNDLALNDILLIDTLRNFSLLLVANQSAVSSTFLNYANPQGNPAQLFTGDLNMLQSTNTSFVNKLTGSTSTTDLVYYSPTLMKLEVRSPKLNFQKR
jgi:hypothetical protein